MEDQSGWLLSLRELSDQSGNIKVWLSRLPLIIIAYLVYYLGEFGNLKGYDRIIIRGILLVFAASVIWFAMRSYPSYQLKDRLPIILLIILFVFYPYHNDWWWWIFHGGGPAPISELYVDRLDLVMLVIMILAFSYGFPDEEMGIFVKIRPYVIFSLLFFIKIFTIFNFPEPDIDVWQVLMIGPDHLLNGVNPYEAQYPPNFAHDGNTFFYPPGIIMVLLPLRLLALDIRYLYLFAEFTIAFMIYYKMGENTSSELLAIPLLVLPYSYFFLHYAWTEMIILPILAALILWGDEPEFENYRGVLFGILGTMKQSMWLVLPFYGIYLLIIKKEDMVKEATISAITFLAIMLPFFLWSPDAFIDDLWIFPQNQERYESLTINSYLFHRGYSLVTTNLFLIPYGLSLILFLWLILSRPDHAYMYLFKFAIITQFAFFLWGRLAFMNHYHLIVGTMYLLLLKMGKINHLSEEDFVDEGEEIFAKK